MNRTVQAQIATSAESRAVSPLALASLLFLGVLASAHAQTNYQRIKSFGFPELSGGGPSLALIEGKPALQWFICSAKSKMPVRSAIF